MQIFQLSEKECMYLGKSEKLYKSLYLINRNRQDHIPNRKNPGQKSSFLNYNQNSKVLKKLS